MGGWLLALLVVLGADASSLERRLDEAIPPRLEKTRVPGLVVSVVADGEVVLAKGWGSADLADGRAMTAQTPVRVASLSKTFTATAIAMLESQGRVDVDADVQLYLGEGSIRRAFDEPITLRHLLSHTSGVINNNVGRVRLEPLQEDLGDFLAATMPPRVYPPGRAVLYSNHGNALAGRIVELQGGRPFSEFIRTQILVPLEMNDSGYAVPAGLAQSYVIDGEELEPQVYLHFRTVPASGMITTAQDMARYMLLHAGDGRPLLDAKAMARMRATVHPIHEALPAYHYAFAHSRFAGHEARAHGGSVPAFLSRFVILDEQGVGVFVAQNAFGENLTGEVAKLVVEEMLGSVSEPEMPRGKPPGAGAFVGTYRMLSKRHTPAFTQPIATLLDREVDVGLDSDEQLQVDGKRFHWVAEGVFRAPKKTGGFETLVFVAHDDGELWMHRDFASGYRRPSLAARWLHSGLIALCLLALTTVFLMPKRVGKPTVLFAGIALVGFVLPHLYVLYVDAGQPLYLQPMRLGAPWWLPFVRAFRFVAIAGGVVLLVRGEAHRQRRRAVAAATAAALTLVAIELYWSVGDPGL